MSLMEHPLIEEYLQSVCSQIKQKEAHREIKLELASHLSDSIDEFMDHGLSKEKAVRRAIQQMGDPILLGKQLHITHKPKIEWSILGLMILLSGIGLLTLRSLDVGRPLPFNNVFFGQLLWFGLGIVIFLVLLFFDYRRLKPLSRIMFFAPFMTIALSGFIKINMNIDLVINNLTSINDFYLLIFIVSLAGIFSEWNWNRKWSLAKASIYLFLPILLIYTMSTNALLYLVSASLMIIASKPSKKHLVGLFSISLVVIGGVITFSVKMKPYLYGRLINFLNLNKDPLGEGYQIKASLDTIGSAGLWGNGYGSFPMLPASASDFIFSSMIYSFGWVTGIIVSIMVLLFIFRAVKAISKINDRYGVMIGIGAISIIGVQFLWGILMAIGYLPVLGISFPFISYGGSHLFMEMVLMGLILGIYRRKDLVKIS